MKVVFVYPDIIGTGKNWLGLYNHGIGVLSAVLKKAGHETSLIHIKKPISKKAFLGGLAKESPQIVAFSSTTHMFQYVKEWSRWVKKNFNFTTICGGYHPTLVPEEVIQEESLDALCVGEGEQALVDFCKYVEKKRDKNIPNIWLKENNHVIRNHPGPLQNLDDFPFPDKSIFDYANLTYGKGKGGIFMASRGCPYNCSYCCNKALKEKYSSNNHSYVRFKSVEHVMAEIEEELRNYPFIERLGFDDDILPLKRRWFEEFAKAYAKNIHLPFACNLRANLVNKEVVTLLKEAGCDVVSMGIESGNEFIRNNILNRQMTKEHIIQACALLKEAGIRIYSYNMVGLPLEDMRRRLDTVKINAEVKSDSNQCSIFFPYPETPLYKFCEENNLLTNKRVDNFFQDTTLAFSSLERKRILFVQRFFRILVLIYEKLYKLPPKLSKTLINLADFFLSSKLVATVFFPIFLGLYKLMMSTEVTNRIGRKILRYYLETPPKERK